MKTKQEKKAEKQADQRIADAFNARCTNIQINIMDTLKINKHGHALIAAGADDVALGDGIRAFVETIRQN